MPHVFAIFISFLFGLALSAQEPGPWIKYTDQKTGLAGFKDLNGAVTIAARFENYFVPDTFHHVMPVREKSGRTYLSYYLLKDGRRVATDSLYDFGGYDCESEGMILYRDWQKYRVGYLDKNGIAVIPAVYNFASPFRNGLAVAHINAIRRCWEESDDTTDCDHLVWRGGTDVLINEKNEILADSIQPNLSDSIDWFSLQINNRPADTSIYTTVQGKNGNSYSFIRPNREFGQWFTKEFLPGLAQNSSQYLFDVITTWTPKESWKSMSKTEYLKKYGGLLNAERFKETPNRKLSFGTVEFNGQIMNAAVFRQFYNACGQFDKQRYPTFSVKLTYYKKGEFDHSESVDFMRTAGGYRMVAAPVTK